MRKPAKAPRTTGGEGVFPYGPPALDSPAARVSGDPGAPGRGLPCG